MNDEIKEILEEIDNKIIPNEHWNKIKDYITNLQEENKRLNNIIDELEKAILNTYPCMNMYEQDFKSELLNILKELKEGK